MNLKLFLISLFVLATVFQLFSQEKEDKTLKVAAIPLISYNRTIELSLGAMVNGYYKVNKTDTISPSSSTSLIGVYTTNKSYFGAVIQKFYLDDDNWRITFIGGYGNANLQVYTELIPGGSFLDYQTFIKMVSLDIKRQVINNLYFGLSGAIARAETTFFKLGENYTDNQDLNNIGVNLLFDSRDNVNYPEHGYQVELNNQFFEKWMGNDSSFTKITIAFNKYWNLRKKDRQVLLVRAYSVLSFGNVPFQGENTVRGDDIRGYSKGQYRDKQIYSLQSEYRSAVSDSKFGWVAFAGVAAAVPDFNGLFNTTILPGGGVGIRYMLIEKEKINIGLDVGIGKNDWSLTFRIGEAFSR